MLTPEALPVLAAITLERDRQLTELGWTPAHDDHQGTAHPELANLAPLCGHHNRIKSDKPETVTFAPAPLVAGNGQPVSSRYR